MELKSQLMTTEEIRRAMKRIAHQIEEKNGGTDNLILIGIAKGGVALAYALSSYMRDIHNCQIPTGIIDISEHRDDNKVSLNEAAGLGTNIPCDIKDKNVVLVDDVLYTGRTVRAALDALSEMGRASSVQLAVLIDRGHRELPIHADYVGKNIPTSRKEVVKVIFDENHDNPIVNIYDL